MKRLVLALAAACSAAVLLPGLASATEVQLGVTTTPLAAPTCPPQATAQATETDCAIVLTKTTAFENVSDGVSSPDLVTAPGEIASFSLGVSGLAIQGVTLASELSTLDTAWGGGPSAQLTVLRPVVSRSGARWAVAAQSPVMELSPFLGGVSEFPLTTPLPVVRGELLAITVPTWAPILTFGLSTSQFSYSQSHTQIITGGQSSCETRATATLAQSTLGEQAQYTCTFQGTRLEYSALEITAPSVVSSSRKHHRVKSHHAAKRSKTHKRRG